MRLKVMLNCILKFIVFFGLLALLPIIIISSLLIYFEDGKPVIFFQKRLGKNKNIFTIYKLRTMRIETPSLGTHEVSEDNYLYWGIILRKTKIDELPQLINFLKGDINLIGPRPGLENQTELIKYREIEKIFDVRPGITGLSQVLGYDMSNPEVLSKIDKLYIKKNNLKIDIYILLATIFKPFKSKVLNLYKNQIASIGVNKDV